VSAHPGGRWPGLFVTGTDTGVGKTLVACALIRGLRARGIDAVGMKAVETGVGPEGPRDALALRAAADHLVALDDVCPLRFALPAAPTVAALAEGRAVEVWAIRRAHQRLAARHECVITEGAGGLLVPLAEGQCMADLARELELPLLVVARAALGTINHTLLTLEAAVARGLAVAGVVISHAGGALAPAEAANLNALRRALGDALLGEIPPLAPGELPPPQALELERLIALAGLQA
jgi:dethiobiotin synthetase